MRRWYYIESFNNMQRHNSYYPSLCKYLKQLSLTSLVSTYEPQKLDFSYFSLSRPHALTKPIDLQSALKPLLT